MGIRLISENCFSVNTRNRNGEVLRTDVYQFENGVFQAYSFYGNDENEVITGYGEDYNDKIAIDFSRKNLRKWKV